MLVPLEVAGSAPYMGSDEMADKGISSSEFSTFEEILRLEPPSKFCSQREELDTIAVVLGHPPRSVLLELQGEVMAEREFYGIVDHCSCIVQKICLQCVDCVLFLNHAD